MKRGTRISWEVLISGASMSLSLDSFSGGLSEVNSSLPEEMLSTASGFFLRVFFFFLCVVGEWDHIPRPSFD